MSILPKSKPQRKRPEIEALLTQNNIIDKVSLVGVRGYYRDSMGKPNQNDRAIYDDAIFLVSPTAYVTFNANVDPGAYRKGIANLKPGVWRYKLGIHGLSKPKSQQYQALVQSDQVTVIRDGQGEDTGWFGINIHRGGNTTTSSLGCQTIPPSQWEALISLVKAEMTRHGQKTIPYLLTVE